MQVKIIISVFEPTTILFCSSSMPKAILFSELFPSYHPKAGKPTHFVEKIWKYLSDSGCEEAISKDSFLIDTGNSETDPELIFKKSHTIRSGFRWKENDLFSPRIWSGPAYRSKQIPF